MPTISTPDLPVTLLVSRISVLSYIGTARAVWGAERLRNGTVSVSPSVRLSVPAWATAARFAAVARSAVDIVRLLHG